MSSNDGHHPQKGSFHGRRPPLSLSRHKVFSSKGCVATSGTLQFRRACSRYRVLARKRCVAEGKAAQCPEICSRYRVLSQKGYVAGRTRRVNRIGIGRENIREEEKKKEKKRKKRNEKIR
jgi:hypothetical protein